MTTTVETWLPAVGWEREYDVSDHGQVRSRGRYVRNGVESVCWRAPALKAQTPHVSEQYMQVGLWCGGERRTVKVAHLVLETFVGPRPAGMEACHGPAGWQDNGVTNLRWDTRSATIGDQVLDGTHAASGKDACGFGHRLVRPNLVESKAAEGVRQCKACHRADAPVRRAAARGVALDRQTVADEKYATIMREAK